MDFIHYARDDTDFADRIFVENSLLASSSWRSEILTEIETSDFIILTLSNRSISKEGLFQKKVRATIERLSLVAPGRLVIIPVRVEEC